MIQAEDLRRQTANKYPAVVQELLRGETPFPLFLRYPHIRTTAPRDAILADIATLRTEAERGLTIQWQRIDTVRYGTNDLPGDICLATEEDYFRYTDKTAEIRAIRAAADILQAAFPSLAAELPHHWRLLREGDAAFWENVCRVLRYFRDNPFPDCYVRELPIAVPTKFIEQNRSVLEPLLQSLAPESLRAEGETFAERLGLKTPDSLVECRLLDDTLQPEWKFRQFTITVSDLPHLAEIPAGAVLITENRTNFLTLPALPATIAIQGQGYAVSRLARADFLHSRRILYWGDLDAQGFEILALLRRTFPQTESILMDEETWDTHAALRHDGVRSRLRSDQLLGHLSVEESALYQTICARNQRLEQEQIPQRYVVPKLTRIFGHPPGSPEG